MKIKLTEEQARDFAWGDLEGFTLHETVEDAETIYKEMIGTETICKQDSTGKFFSMYWNNSISHFSEGEHQYDYLELSEVESVEVVKVTKEWRVVE